MHGAARSSACGRCPDGSDWLAFDNAFTLLTNALADRSVVSFAYHQLAWPLHPLTRCLSLRGSTNAFSASVLALNDLILSL